MSEKIAAKFFSTKTGTTNSRVRSTVNGNGSVVNDYGRNRTTIELGEMPGLSPEVAKELGFGTPKIKL